MDCLLKSFYLPIMFFGHCPVLRLHILDWLKLKAEQILVKLNPGGKGNTISAI